MRIAVARNSRQDALLTDEHPGVNPMRENLPRVRLLDEARDPVAGRKADNTTAFYVVTVNQRHRHHRRAVVVPLDHARKVDRRIRVAIADDEWPTKPFLKRQERPSCAVRFLTRFIGVCDRHVEPRTVAEVVPDDVATIVQVDGDVGDAVLRHKANVVFQNRAAGDLYHGFWNRVRQRTQTASLTSGENECFHFAPRSSR